MMLEFQEGQFVILYIVIYIYIYLIDSDSEVYCT